MHEILDLPDTNIAALRLSDTLTEEDYEDVESYLGHMFEAHTTARVLLELDDVSGWEPEEKWQNLTFDLRQLEDVDKVAIVGEAADDFHETLTDKLDVLFGPSQVKYYPDADREEALEWLRGEMEVPGIGPGSTADPTAGAQDE